MVDPGKRFEANIGRVIRLMGIILLKGRFTEKERARRQSILDDFLLALDDWSRLDLPVDEMSRERLLQHQAEVLEAGMRCQAAVDRCRDFVMLTKRTGGYNGERLGCKSRRSHTTQTERARERRDKMGRPREPLDLSTYRNRFADRLVKLREKKGMIVEDAVAALQSRGVSISRSALCRIEAGQANIDLEIIPDLAAIYGVTPRTLFPEK